MSPAAATTSAFEPRSGAVSVCSFSCLAMHFFNAWVIYAAIAFSTAAAAASLSINPLGQTCRGDFGEARSRLPRRRRHYQYGACQKSYYKPNTATATMFSRGRHDEDGGDAARYSAAQYITFVIWLLILSRTICLH